MNRPLSRRSAGGAVSSSPLCGANDESRVYLESPAGRGVDRKVIAVLLITALVLTLHHYQGEAQQLAWIPWLLTRLGLTVAAASVGDWLAAVKGSPIDWWTFWALAGFVCYGVLPALVVKFVFRERLADYGLKLHGAFADGWVYLVMLAVMGPLVFAMSFNAHFQATYPFYTHPKATPLWPDFWRWELAYGMQFVGVEFLFRGFMVHGLRRRFGAYSIVVMTVPYCMIHFAKPLPETLASIVAGLVLGFMSLRSALRRPRRGHSHVGGDVDGLRVDVAEGLVRMIGRPVRRVL